MALLDLDRVLNRPTDDANVTTLQTVELGVLGPLQVRKDGAPVVIPGAKPRAILTILGLHSGAVVSADSLIQLLWGDDPPRTADKALQTHISSLRRTLGDGVVLTEGAGWNLAEAEVDASRYKLAAKTGRDAAAAGDTSQAVACFEEALTLWRGIPELPDNQRGLSEKTRWIEGHAALVEDRADALLATGRAAEITGELEAAVAEAPLRERRWGQLMLALYRSGRQGEALAAYRRARLLLANELGVDPGPDLRRLEAAIVAQDAVLDMPVAQQLPSVTRAVTFLLTDIEGSTAAWEADSPAMAIALARHDEIVEQIVTSRGGRLIKTRGEGDATFSVFERPSAAAAAAIELQDAIVHEPWALQDPMRIRVALHTGEVELRDGDYFGRAVNRAARLRSLATGGQILCSGATAELVIDSLPDDVVLADLGMRQLRNLARPEHVFELRMETSDEASEESTTEPPLERPDLPAVLAGPGPFVGRGRELEKLFATWQTALAGGMRAVLIAGEPGVGKTRLAGEWSRQAYDQGAVVIYGRCDEDLGAPYQPFAEALRSLVPCLGSTRLRELRGVESLLPLVPGLTDVLPDLSAPARADPDTERYALFDAVVALLEIASTSAPVVLILDDLHWAAKPTLLLLRHLLRFGEHARVQIVGTYRSTDLDRSHPLAAMLADLHRDGTANRVSLSGLDENDVTTYVAEAGYDDEELARALASVTGGNPFFLIEALRHVEESGGHWDQSTLPQGVREAVSRRLSRLPAETNKALAAAAVVGSRFAVDLVERVLDDDLVDAFDEASKAGIVIEEPGGHYRFNHALVRQSLLAELASVRRMRLHQRIATTLEAQPGADDELLAELAHHYFECAWAGNAAKAVEYCQRAADQAMARLGYEGAADLYDHALHALEEIDDELPDRDDQAAELLIARCEALLAAGDVASAVGAVSQLQEATSGSARLAAWATCFDGQLSMLTHPERLDDIETAVGAAADKLAELDDAAGEAKAHTVRAGCLARLGRVGDCEVALDDALTAARRARDHRRVNAVLAGAPLAALWGPNPVPRAGGRCLDVVRLLRITTDSPAVEATSTRCQAVLEAFRGRAAAARRMIDSARRTVTELGLRHALLEVEQFAGIVELVVDDPAAAEPHLRKAYNGFRRMRLDADTAETAALLASTCLALNRDAEAGELCSESERLAGHALKASIAWRTVRALLLSRGHDHDGARRMAEAAVSLAERTDDLVDHGDACLALAAVLEAGGDAAGARAAAERAADLYEQKGAAALAEKARSLLGKRVAPPAAPPPEEPAVELDNACVRVVHQIEAAFQRDAWNEIEERYASNVHVESRRKVVGLDPVVLSPSEWVSEIRRFREMGLVRHSLAVVAARGDRLALIRTEVGTSDASSGAPQDESLQLYGLDKEGRIALHVWFDVEDIDAAIAELDATHVRYEEEPPLVRLENAAQRVLERYMARFADRDWDAMAPMLADDFLTNDRRRVVNAGVRQGRDAEIANMQSIADLGTLNITSTAIATRGERLVLARHNLSIRDWPEANAIGVVEINADNQLSAHVMFDADDIDGAIAELDARYLAGEAAPYSRTWSVIPEGYAAFNRRELPPMTPDCVNFDHRRGAAFAAGELVEYIRAGWELDQNLTVYVEAVHRLNDRGAVVTHAAYGTSQEGFDAEWRGVNISMVEGEKFSRFELFGEADLDAAIAKFDQLSRPAPQLENAASQVAKRFQAHFAAGDWDAMAEILADDFSNDDRRRVVSAGVRHGRDAQILDMRAIADLRLTNVTSNVIATRGESLVLMRAGFSELDQASEAFLAEFLSLGEINADNRIAAHVAFDPDDFDAAIAELDTRYLAGEAAPHARVWQLGMDTIAELNRHESGPMTARLKYVDHRRVPFAPGDYGRAVEELWQLVPNARYWTKAVHALDAHGTVVSAVVEGTDAHGNELQWSRVVSFFTDDARVEVYEENDLDAALARFELHTLPAPRLGNAASRVVERYLPHFSDRDWEAMASMLADDFSADDRRRAVNAGVRQGRDAEIANLRAIAEVGVENISGPVIATRGQRLVLCRLAASRGERSEALRVEALDLLEVDDDERIVAHVVFDLDDIDAAFEELDARYLAGEAAPHAHTFSLVARAYAALDRRELSATTPDWVNIDHRRAAKFAPGELIAYLRAGWDLGQDINNYIVAVHRLSRLGAVVTHAAYGASQEGFDAEWREIALVMFEGDLLSRGELFDEADLEAALARFDQLSRPAPRLENAASQADERFWTYFAARDWDAMAEILSDDFSLDDRRQAVNAGIRQGRDAEIENLKVMADVIEGVNITSSAIATRGERLTLRRFSGQGQGSGAFYNEMVGIVEINADNKLAAHVAFDVDDIDAAFAELDARYLAGEAAPFVHTWSLVAGIDAALNRNEIPPHTQDWVNIDHRRAVAFAPGELTAYLRAGWDVAHGVKNRTLAVHRLSHFGAVVTHLAHGKLHEGFEAEWREVALLMFEGDLVSRGELFDEADLDAALAKFDQLSRLAPRLENAASRVFERFWTCFAARDWAAMTEILSDGISTDDRRRVVNAGMRRGRDAFIADMRAVAEVGTADNITSTVIATRGEWLTLNRIRSRALQTELLNVVELNGDERTMASVVVLDAEEIDSAIEELDARYLAGEAAPHARMWSLVAGAYATLNQHELPPTAPDWVNIDHRRLAPIEPGRLGAYVRETQDAAPGTIYIEAVHRLSDLGAIVSRAVNATSQDGFDAEWREIDLLMFDGDRINRLEIFDETEVGTALTHFEELHPQARRLENAASRVYDRFNACFATRDWDAITEMLADDVFTEDRRRVVNAGVRQGRSAVIAEISGIAGVGVTTISSDTIATRGEHLVLGRIRLSGRDRRPEAFHTVALDVVEIDADERLVARVVFDADDIDAAFEELDARYLAGEAAAHAHTWSFVSRAFAAFNRHELPATAPNWVNIDHRRGRAFASGDLIPYLRATWDVAPQARLYIAAVHRLTNLGVVVTNAADGTSQEGFDAEWREVNLITLDGDMVSRCELFDESDLDAALAQFDELGTHPQLENAASQVAQRFWTCFAARNWDAMAKIVADNHFSDDRRRVQGAGVRHGRDAEIANMRATADIGTQSGTMTVIAIRGQRLTLSRVVLAGRDRRPNAFHTEVLGMAEIDADNRMVAYVVFDADDLDAAFAELDARYLAGEAAPHAHAWSLIARTYSALNRHELPPTTPDWVNVDNRRLAMIEAGGMTAAIRATWHLAPDVRIRIDAVHRLSDFGAVITRTSCGTSHEGFEAEWRQIDLLTFDGDLINRCEIFDESDIAAAVARLDDLSRPAPRLENAASRAYERWQACFALRDWDAVADTFADDYRGDDRRRVVNAGIRQGRSAEVANMQALTNLGATARMLETIATRGDHLALIREQWSTSEQLSEAYHNELLEIFEVDKDERITAAVTFELADMDAAFEELEARYLAGEAAPRAHTWSVITQGYTAANRGELPATAPDLVNIDHRRLAMIESGDLIPYLRDTFDELTNLNTYLEAVHRLTEFGAVVTHVGTGTSEEGFDAEWRLINVVAVDDDLISRSEVFDEADLDAALARFEEVQPQAPRLENAASRVFERFLACFAAYDWEAITEMLADDIFNDDRRRVVNAGVLHGRDATTASMRATADLGGSPSGSTVIATRGERLVLGRDRFSTRDQPSEVLAEVLGIIEIDADEKIVARIAFDADDIDAAFEELESRYLAGEAAPYAQTWSVIADTATAFNRRELFPTTPDWVNIDHRRAAAFAPGEMSAYTHAIWKDAPDSRVYIEAVHRLNHLGAVITEAAHGTSQQGFEAEWRLVGFSTIDRGLINRAEMFDEEDLDAALARFDELRPQAARLENAASRVDERFQACFVARDWTAMGEILADNITADDRRRVVNAGVRHGRDAKIADMRATADLGTKNATSTVIAIRGQRLALVRIRLSGRDQRPDAFHTEMLGITEINADNWMTARILFDPDDIDAAFEELDARYLAGEAAAHAQTWSVITDACTALNRREMFETTPDWVNIDHRHGTAFASGEMTQYIGSAWDLTRAIRIHADAVHRLSNLGAVFTGVAKGTSREGFDAEWRSIAIVTVDRHLISRCELFDEAHLDAALARFEELTRPLPKLENAASRVDDRFEAYFAARDWNGMAELMADDISVDDRRRTVNSGLRRGRDLELANMQAIAGLGVAHGTSTVIATRGARLALSRNHFRGRDQRPEAFRTEALCIIQIGEDERIVARVAFDPDDVDAAFEELDARYLAGEAAAHAHTWSVIANAYSSFNRREMFPTTPDWTNIDHRGSGTAFAPGDLVSYIHATWDVAPHITSQAEAVHRLSNHGAVFTQVVRGTSQEGFEAEWREIAIATVQGDLLDRVELFDESDVDSALARFEELSRPASRLENTAGQVADRYLTHFAGRDWDAMAACLADEFLSDDRRRVVGAGVRHGRDAEIADMRAIADLWGTVVTSTAIATRGARLILSRARFSGGDKGSETFHTEVLSLVEIDADERIKATVQFDTDDIDAAFAELDARYLAGEAAAHSRTWSVVAGVYAALNRHELPATTADWVQLDHRPLVTIEAGDMAAHIRAFLDQMPNVTIYIEAVQLLTDLGAVITHAAHGVSREGFDAEWRMVFLYTVENDLISRSELFDEADIDAALARFDELDRSTPVLENAATRAWARAADAINRRDIDGFLALAAPGARYADQRKGLRDEQTARPEVVRALFEITRGWQLHTEPVAIRGSHLGLSRDTYRDMTDPERPITLEHLTLYEFDADGLGRILVLFDPDDINGAMAELTARWIASGEVAHPEVIESVQQLTETINRHDWAAVAKLTADAAYVSHRQLSSPDIQTVADQMSSIQTMASLVPDFWIEQADVLAHSASGLVSHLVLRGTSSEGARIEIPVVQFTLLDGDRFTRIEAFDPDQRDVALARFDELSQSG